VSPDPATRMMPTRMDLAEAGHADLIRVVMQAGGFLNVADRLGLRTKRRPVGFWDNIDTLDQVRHTLHTHTHACAQPYPTTHPKEREREREREREGGEREERERV
jgi:hypothetical protein